MSRTYRKSWMNDWRSNLESAQTRYGWHHYYEPEEVEDPQEYFKWFRDCWSETSRSSGFKEESQRNIRSKNRKCISILKKDVEAFDDMDFPDKYTEKHLIWSYW